MKLVYTIIIPELKQEHDLCSRR